MRDYLAELIAIPLLPLLLLQGRRTRLVTPRLPEATGPCDGLTGAEPGQTLRLLTFGESPVAGVGVDTHERAITGQLALALANRMQRPVAWQACGRNGATVREAIETLVSEVPPDRVDVLLVAFGVNDTTRFRSLRRWQADVSALLQALEGRCQPRLILLSGVPPVAHFPALPQPLRLVMGLKAQALDRALQRLAQGRPGTLYVPLLLDTADPALMADDGYHPSARGCSAWAGLLADACSDKLACPEADSPGEHTPPKRIGARSA